MDALHQFMYYSNMNQRVPTDRIENFSLFGEAGEMPDTVHCETIETRSPLHDWEFKPHRHQRLHQILLMDTGGGAAKLDSLTGKLRAGSLMNVPSGCVHSFVFARNTMGWVVTLATELLDEVLQMEDGLFSVLSRPVIVQGDVTHRELIIRIFGEHAQRSFGRAHILRSQSALLLGHVARTIRKLDNSDMPQCNDPLQARFEKLVDQNFQKQWSVADYARHLSVTPTHLSRVLRKSTGLPASRLIEARVLREARRHLFFTNLGVSQIAYLLGYEDPAYFSRVFSRATGLSPKAFRAQTERSA